LVFNGCDLLTMVGCTGPNNGKQQISGHAEHLTFWYSTYFNPMNGLTLKI